MSSQPSIPNLWERLKIPVWAGIWILSRAMMAAQVGFWKPQGPEYQDVDVYHHWSNVISATGALPPEETWQYPPGTAFLMLIPRIGGESFRPSFVILMLAFDLIGLWLMTRFAKQEKRDVGVWIWLLVLPVIGSFSLLRFDLVPTVIAVAALLVLHRRPAMMGVLAGAGAMIKVWPAFVLFAEWERRRILRSIGAAVAAAAVIWLLAAAVFGDTFGFLTNQKDRGLQIEAVAASPWNLRDVITDKNAPVVQRFGALEIGSDLADAVAKALDLLALLLLLAAAWWWWARDRAIKRGRSDLADKALGRDFVFTVALLSVVISRVLSPQYMIWLVGLCAVVLSTRGTRVARPAWIVIGAVIITAGLYQSPANFVVRNLALLYASIEAAVVLTLLVLTPKKELAESAQPRSERPG